MSELDDMQAKADAEIKAFGAMTEEQMREAEVPRIKSLDELNAYIGTLVDRPHDYGTCVYAMSMAAVAAFNYVAGCLGVTGFQASCADMDILSRTRKMKCPWMIVKAEDLLYPQYDVPGRVNEVIDGWQSWLKEQAEKKLAEANGHAHPDVRAHWERLAK